jgi:hypothetical protein
MGARATRGDDAKRASFTVSARATTAHGARASFATTATAQRVTLDDVDEFNEEKRRAANDARARTIGNALLAASLLWSAVRGAWTSWRRRRAVKEEADARDDDGGDDDDANDANDDDEA